MSSVLQSLSSLAAKVSNQDERLMAITNLSERQTDLLQTLMSNSNTGYENTEVNMNEAEETSTNPLENLISDINACDNPGKFSVKI